MKLHKTGQWPLQAKSIFVDHILSSRFTQCYWNDKFALISLNTAYLVHSGKAPRLYFVMDGHVAELSSRAQSKRLVKDYQGLVEEMI